VVAVLLLALFIKTRRPRATFHDDLRTRAETTPTWHEHGFDVT